MIDADVVAKFKSDYVASREAAGSPVDPAVLKLRERVVLEKWDCTTDPPTLIEVIEREHFSAI